MNYEKENYQPVAKAARTLWIIHGCISTVIFLAVLIGVYLIAYKHVWIFGLAVLEAIYGVLIKPAVEYRQWRYLIGEDRIEIIHGIFFTKRSLIPINRIQHLRIEQGILQKRFDLASVDIYTAGGSHQIHALHYDEADAIVRRLNHIVAAEAEMPDEIMEEEAAKPAEPAGGPAAERDDGNGTEA